MDRSKDFNEKVKEFIYLKMAFEYEKSNVFKALKDPYP
jgi:hypothetical protein